MSYVALAVLGIVALVFFMLFNACEMQAFGIPYTAPFAPGSKAVLRDGILRSNWKKLAAADFTVKDLPDEKEG